MVISKKRGAYIASAILLFTCAFLSIAHAEIIVNQMPSLFNVGDDFSVSASVVGARDTTSFVTAQLLCGSTSLEIYKSLLTLQTGQRKDILIEGKFNNAILPANRDQNCVVKFAYDNTTAQTAQFQITSAIDMAVSLDGTSFAPNDHVKVTGSAQKKTGTAVNGFIEMKAPELSVNYYNTLQEGNFAFEFPIPQNAKPGQYTITAHIYEKDSDGKITSEGSLDTAFTVRQIIKDLKLAPQTETSVTPGEDFQVTPTLYDQVEGAMDGEVALTFMKPDKFVVQREVVKSGAPFVFHTEQTSVPGNWKIEAKASNYTATQDFYIEELMTATFTLENETLLVTNTGNVPYTRPVAISIGDFKTLEEGTIGVGASKRIKLVPQKTGTYPIQVDDGSAHQQFENVSLQAPFLATAMAASLNEGVGALARNSGLAWIWVLLIIILIVVAYLWYKKIQKKRYTGHSPSHQTITTKVSTVLRGTRSMPMHQKSTQGKHAIEGNKEEVTIVALNIRNLPQLQSMSTTALSTIEKCVTHMKESKAKVYADGDFRLFIFSPSVLKVSDPTVLAVQRAQEIEQILQGHNKRYADIINFGIGIHSGEIITQMRDGKFGFSPLGSTISVTKRLASYAKEEALLSERTHRKTPGKIKAEKVGDMNIWRVKRIIDRTQHEEFISKFKQRNAIPPSQPSPKRSIFPSRPETALRAPTRPALNIRKPSFPSRPMPEKKADEPKKPVETYTPDADDADVDDLIGPS